MDVVEGGGGGAFPKLLAGPSKSLQQTCEEALTLLVVMFRRQSSAQPMHPGRTTYTKPSTNVVAHLLASDHRNSLPSTPSLSLEALPRLSQNH